MWRTDKGKLRRFLMDGLVLLLVALTLILLFSSCTFFGDKGEVIVWADPAFERAVRNYLKKPSGDITTSELKEYKSVYIWHNGIQLNSLNNEPLDDEWRIEKADDIVHFKNVNSVLFANLLCEDVNVLSGITGIQRVVLIGNKQLTDISGIASLPELTSVIIEGNRSLGDFSPLSEMKGLTTLSLNICKLEDIGFMSELNNLRLVTLHNNQITDLSPLMGSRESLEELDIRSNNISDIGVFASFTNLVKLRMELNYIEDLSALSGLKKLRVLALDGNSISDLSPLGDLAALRTLTLKDNPLTAAEVAALRMRLDSSCSIEWE